LDCKVSVISAPAGYGKTTLLAHWRRVEEAEVPFAWLSLDEQDNDPIRLWRHIVEALRQILPEEEGFGADVLVGMSAVGQRFVETTLSMLINRLAELPHPVVLVLDDYQFVTGEVSHNSVAFFVEHLPENVHLVISGRSDPPLPLGALRARAEMNEIRTEELAFTEEEAVCLLNEKMGLGIDPDDLSVLLERTEGWPAGIYLASLSLRNKEDKHAFIESFRGSNSYVVGLLGEEVLAQLPEDVRKFLLETSVLRRLTGPICDAVTGREGSARLLRELARSNLFVVSLDEQGEWYRYHHLFSELLLYELKSSQPNLVPTLRKRASVWLEDAGYYEGAIRQAIAATDYERVGVLIARHWYGYAVTGHSATVERWLESLPEGMSAQNAALCLVEAWLCALGGRREECERFLTLAEGVTHEGTLPDGTASVGSGVVTLRAIFGFGGIEDMGEAARRAAALGLDRTSPQAPLVKLGLGMSWYFSGNVVQARRVLEGGLRLTDGGHPIVRIGMLSFQSFAATDEGHPEEAESLAREAKALVDRFRLQGIPQATLAPIALGRALAGHGKQVRDVAPHGVAKQSHGSSLGVRGVRKTKNDS
jgi:LuxR family maltose regulon positive regulatory protein